ncbi:MAG: hypothetical protein U0900_21985 [Myxococcota bacterium]
MTARHIEQHYGFGAARIAIRGEMHRVSDSGLAGDFAAMLSEAGAGGPGAVARRFVGPVLGLITTCAFLGFVIAGLMGQEAEREALEVVMLESAEAVPPPIVPPMVEIPVEPEPIVPEPVVPEPVKPEPPPIVAKVEPPPPPKVEPPKVEPPKIEPVRIQPEIAKVAPPPVERAPRPVVRERPVPVSKPRVAIDAVAVAPDRAAPVAPSERIARASAQPVSRAMPRMDAPAAPSLDLPSEAAPERAFRVAAAHAPAGTRPRAIPGVAPASVGTADLDLPPARSAPTRGAAVARPAGGAQSRPVPRFELDAAPAAASASEGAAPQVVARAERAARPAASAGGGAGSARPGLSGVPLGELSACVTDREEDRLKQAVVAAVKTQSECVSSKGTYRFVETKNLNAFLMWIDRAPSRRVEDRCAELRYALECLQGANRRASR